MKVSDNNPQKGQGFIYFAHRGDNQAYPENTAAAFNSSIEKGFSAVELDLITIADGKVVVFHDDTLQRLAGSRKKAASLTLTQFKKLFPNLLTFEDFVDMYSSMRLYGGKSLFANFEVKDSRETLESMDNGLKKWKLSGADYVISSFDPSIVDYSIAVEHPSAYLFHRYRDFKSYSSRLFSSRLHLSLAMLQKMKPATLEKFSEFDVYVYTVNHSEDRDWLMGFDFIQGIFTDNPAILPWFSESEKLV